MFLDRVPSAFLLDKIQFGLEETKIRPNFPQTVYSLSCLPYNWESNRKSTTPSIQADLCTLRWRQVSGRRGPKS
jgi:hypothetical protein